MPAQQLAPGTPVGEGYQEVSVTLAGRRRECAVIGRHLRRAARGEGAALVLTGPAGIGKTALLDYAADQAPAPAAWARTRS